MTSNIAIQFAQLTARNYTHFDGGDKETGQFINHAALQNFFSGMSIGLNTISGDKIDGLTNRHVSFKDKQFFEEHGFYPDPTFASVA